MRILGIVGALALASALAGCSNAHGDLEAADSPVARYDWDSSGDSMKAQLSGSLELRDGCLVVNQNEDVRTPVVAVFPRQFTSWRADSTTLTYGGANFPVGADIMAGGGSGGSSPAEGDIPDACRSLIDDQIGVFYIQDHDIAPPSL